jgi:hypothetical protein
MTVTPSRPDPTIRSSAPAGARPKRRRPRLAVIVIIAVVVVLAAVVAAVTIFGGPTRTVAGEPVALRGSGERFSPPGGSYSLEIPTGVVKVPPREDDSIPSYTELSLELDGKVNYGGVITTGILAGPAATGSYAEVGEEADRKYSGQYGGHPDLWGTGAKVEKKTTRVGGKDAVEIDAQFSPGADPEPSTFFRIYFVDPPTGSALLITCDWNTSDTSGIRDACDSLVASFKVRRT